jgi:two-component system, response regulator
MFVNKATDTITTRKTLGKTLKMFRNQLGITQEELAWRASLNRSFVADVERGKRNLSLASIEKLAAALQVSIASLFDQRRGQDSLVPGDGTGPRQPVEILLVEDDFSDIELTRRAFRLARLENLMHVVDDGPAALSFLRRRTAKSVPANFMVLLDLGLPQMDGVAVLRRMKGDPRLRRIPVVVLTGSREAGHIAECRWLGAANYITKPVDFQSFSSITPHLSLGWMLPGTGAGEAL